MNIQIIEKNGKPEWAILPYSEYLELLEDQEDNKKISSFKKRLSIGKEELIPENVVNRITAGENPIKIYREFRKLSLSELAERAGLSAPYLSQLEHNERKGSTDSLNKIAAVLNLSIDDIV